MTISEPYLFMLEEIQLHQEMYKEILSSLREIMSFYSNYTVSA